MRNTLAAIVAAFSFSCASLPVDLGGNTSQPEKRKTVYATGDQDPSPEHPKVGCILATSTQSGSHEGKILPEVVLVTGVTSIDDGARWKVLRAPDFDPSKWEPHSKEEIKFGVLCKAGSDLQGMFDASRGDVEAAAKSRPPNH